MGVQSNDNSVAELQPASSQGVNNADIQNLAAGAPEEGAAN